MTARPNQKDWPEQQCGDRESIGRDHQGRGKRLRPSDQDRSKGGAGHRDRKRSVDPSHAWGRRRCSGRFRRAHRAAAPRAGSACSSGHAASIPRGNRAPTLVAIPRPSLAGKARLTRCAQGRARETTTGELPGKLRQTSRAASLHLAEPGNRGRGAPTRLKQGVFAPITVRRNLLSRPVLLRCRSRKTGHPLPVRRPGGAAGFGLTRSLAASALVGRPAGYLSFVLLRAVQIPTAFAEVSGRTATRESLLPLTGHAQ